MDALRIGFIGIGMTVVRVFRERPGLSGLPYLKVVAAADPRQNAREAFRQEFGGEVFESAEALCASPNVDAVYVATPPELHAEHAILAARHGKHVVVEKPMALSVDECEAMIRAADQHGVKLMAGHTHSFDPPVQKMREIIRGGELGRLAAIATWNFNDFNYRPWPYAELRTTRGPILNQGPHQVDVVRLLGGGLARSVRATTIWDPGRQTEGGYSAFLEFEDGASATLVFDARGFFDTTELHWGIGEGGRPRDLETNAKMRRNFPTAPEAEMEPQLDAAKEKMRYGAGPEHQDAVPDIWRIWAAGHGAPGEQHQPFFGLTVVSCERGTLRQSPDGITVHGIGGSREVAVQPGMSGRQAEFTELYESLAQGRPIVHDGRWGAATLEVCFAILQSARERREITLARQVPSGD